MELAEGDIADGNIEKVIREGSLLIALHRNTAALIKLAGDASGEIVQLHAVELAAAHIFRQHTEEIADAAGRLQDVPLCEAHLPQGGIDAADDHRRRKERRQRGFAGGGVFGIRQQFFQFSVTRIFFVKEVRQTAPTYILRQHRLFLRCGGAVLRLHGFQGTDRVQIALKTLQRRTLSDMVIGDAVVAAVRVQRIGKRTLLFLFRRGEYRRRLVRLRCCGFLHYVRLLHVSADIVDGFLSEDGKSRPAFKGHIPQGYILRMIVYAVHFKLPPIYGQACTDGERFGDFRFHGHYGLRWRWHGFLGGCRNFPHQRRCRLIGYGRCQLPIVPVVEQAESAVHIFGKLLLCAPNGAIIAIILRQAVQPGSQRRQHIRSFGLVLKLLFNDGNGIIEVCVFRIGARNFIRGIIETVVDDSSQLPTLIFRDLCDGILARESFLRDQALILLDHIGDRQMDGIIFLGIIVPFVVQPFVCLGVSIPGTAAAAVLAKAVLDEFLAFLRRVGIAEMRVHRQSSIRGTTRKELVDLVLRDEHFTLAQEVGLGVKVPLRVGQTIQHNTDPVGVVSG